MSHHQTDKATDDLLDRIAERGEWWRTALDRLTGVDQLRSQVVELETTVARLEGRLDELTPEWVDDCVDWARAEEIAESATQEGIEQADWSSLLAGVGFHGRLE